MFYSMISLIHDIYYILFKLIIYLIYDHFTQCRPQLSPNHSLVFERDLSLSLSLSLSLFSLSLTHT